MRLDPSAASKVSSGSESSSSRPGASDESSVVHSERTFLAPETVADRVLQDALEEQRQLPAGGRRVLLGEPQHRVLHDVERRFLVAHGEHRLLEGAPLDAGEEIGQLACAMPGVLFSLRGRRAARCASAEWYQTRAAVAEESSVASTATPCIPG